MGLTNDAPARDAPVAVSGRDRTTPKPSMEALAGPRPHCVDAGRPAVFSVREPVRDLSGECAPGVTRIHALVTSRCIRAVMCPLQRHV